MSGYTESVWQDIELRIEPYHFCISFQISSINKKARSNTPLKPKAPFKWGFMDIILATSSKSLTSETTFYNYLLFADAY